MSAVAVDTHAIVWYLNDDGHLSYAAAAALDQATAGGEIIYVPSVPDRTDLSGLEKGRIPGTARERLAQALGASGAFFSGLSYPVRRANGNDNLKARNILFADLS